MTSTNAFKIRALIDLDEVIVDFRGGACRVHGWDKAEVERITIEMGIWDMCKPNNITTAQFWKKITEAGSEFWQTLEPLPWYKEVIKVVEAVTDDWRIVTAPSMCPSSYVGKIQWMRRYFGHSFDKFHITSHKGDLAKQGVILIDDREANVEKFIEAGGYGIVFPSIGNKLHGQRADPVQYVVGQLEILKYISKYGDE